VERTAEKIKDLAGCFQSSASRTKHFSPLFPSSELLGYYQQSALRTHKPTFRARPSKPIHASGLARCKIQSKRWISISSYPRGRVAFPRDVSRKGAEKNLRRKREPGPAHSLPDRKLHKKGIPRRRGAVTEPRAIARGC